MGNRLCKKKNMDCVDHSETKENTFDRLFTRFHLRPKSWTSDSQLSKQLTRSSKGGSGNVLPNTKEYVNVSLEVPDSETKVHITNSKTAPSFSLDNSVAPVAPPRKRKSIKENIEAVAKSSLQILQSKKPVEEPLCVKRTIKYDCPCDKLHFKHNHRDHDKNQENNAINKKEQTLQKSSINNHQKESKRKKNLSVVSLPNYSELKFSLADFDDVSKRSSDEKSLKSSHISLPFENKSNSSKSYMVRCRSFGSILPQQLLEKLKPASNKIANIESDDSFGPLEDWNLELIEHYNPRDASLPRPRKPVQPTDKMSDIENSISSDPIISAELISPLDSISRESAGNSSCVDCVTTKEENLNMKTEGLISKSSASCDSAQLEDLSDVSDKKSLLEKSLHKTNDAYTLSSCFLSQAGTRDEEIVEDFIAAEKLNTNNQLTSSLRT